MKKSLFLFSIISLSAGVFSSCDDEDGNGNVHTKRLVYSSYYDEASYPDSGLVLVESHYEYDSNGRLIKETIDYGFRHSYVNYSYNGFFFSISEKTHVTSGTTNVDGYLINMSESTKDEIMSYYINYDRLGHFIESTCTDSTTYVIYICKENFIWENGDIINYLKNQTKKYEDGSYDEDSIEYSIKYTNEHVQVPLENKADIKFFSLYEKHLGSITACGKLYGNGTKHLPVQIISNKDNETINIDWKLNDDGYPVECKWNDRIINFTWE